MSYNSKEVKVKYHKGDKPSKKFNNRNPRPGNSGQWTNPGVPTEIQSRHITMRDVQDPVKGVDNFGNEQIMLPGMDYVFPGSVVTEYPLPKAQTGLSTRDSVNVMGQKHIDLEHLIGYPGGYPNPTASMTGHRGMNKVINYVANQGYGSAMNQGQINSWLYNAGFDFDNNKQTINPKKYILGEYYRKYEPYKKEDWDVNWGWKRRSTITDQEADKLYNELVLKKSEEEQQLLINNAKDWFYKNRSGVTPHRGINPDGSYVRGEYGDWSPDYEKVWGPFIRNQFEFGKLGSTPTLTNKQKIDYNEYYRRATIPIEQRKKGGPTNNWLNKYQTEGEVQPIKVTDPNDPRLRAYNDSLDLYKMSLNTYKGWANEIPKISKEEYDRLSQKEKGLIFYGFDEAKYQEDIKNKVELQSFDDYIYSSPYSSFYDHPRYIANQEYGVRNKGYWDQSKYIPNTSDKYDIVLKNGDIKRPDSLHDGKPDWEYYTVFSPNGVTRHYSKDLRGKPELLDIYSPSIKPIRTEYYGEDKLTPISKITTSSISTTQKNKEKPKFVKDSNNEYQNNIIRTTQFDVYKKPVQPVELIPTSPDQYTKKYPHITKAPMLEPSSNLSMDILDDGRGNNRTIPIDRIMMPSGEEVSRSSFIKTYGKAAWDRATNQGKYKKQKGGSTGWLDKYLPKAQTGLNPFLPQIKPTVDAFNKQQKLAEEYTTKKTGKTLQQRQKDAGINPMTGKPWPTSAIEESISLLDVLPFFSVARKLPGVIKSVMPKKVPPKSVVNVFPEEFAKKYSELGTYITDVKPNKWLYPPDEYLGRKTGGSKLPTHLPEAYKKGGNMKWLEQYQTTGNVIAQRDATNMVYKPVKPITVESEFPYYNTLTAEEKKLFNSKSPIGAAVRTKASTGKRSDVEGYGKQLLNKTLYTQGAGLVAPYVLAPAIKAGMAVAPFVGPALNTSIAGVPGLTGANILNTLGIVGGVPEIKEGIQEGDYGKTAMGTIGVLLGGYDLFNPALYRTASSVLPSLKGTVTSPKTALTKPEPQKPLTIDDVPQDYMIEAKGAFGPPMPMLTKENLTNNYKFNLLDKSLPNYSLPKFFKEAQQSGSAVDDVLYNNYIKESTWYKDDPLSYLKFYANKMGLSSDQIDRLNFQQVKQFAEDYNKIEKANALKSMRDKFANPKNFTLRDAVNLGLNPNKLGGSNKNKWLEKYQITGNVIAPRDATSVVHQPTKPVTFVNEYLFYNNLTAKEKELFKDPGPIGRSVRAKATSGKRSDVQGFGEKVLKNTLYPAGAAIVAPYLAAPVIKGAMTVGPAIGLAMDVPIAGVPGLTVRKVLGAYGVKEGAPMIEEGIEKGDPLTTALGVGSTLFSIYDIYNPAVYKTASSLGVFNSPFKGQPDKMPLLTKKDFYTKSQVDKNLKDYHEYWKARNDFDKKFPRYQNLLETENEEIYWEKFKSLYPKVKKVKEADFLKKFYLNREDLNRVSKEIKNFKRGDVFRGDVLNDKRELNRFLNTYEESGRAVENKLLWELLEYDPKKINKFRLKRNELDFNPNKYGGTKKNNWLNKYK